MADKVRVRGYIKKTSKKQNNGLKIYSVTAKPIGLDTLQMHIIAKSEQDAIDYYKDTNLLYDFENEIEWEIIAKDLKRSPTAKELKDWKEYGML